jgi:spore coat polysaccharide biosynthesis protein SpsF
MKNYGVIIAARMGSQRLPGKALLPLKGLPMIAFIIRRLLRSELVKSYVLATTSLKEDDELEIIARNEGIDVFRGESEDVVKRFVDAAAKFDLEYVVRVTGDCPFVDGDSLDYCLGIAQQSKDFDLATTKSYFPVGIDYEIYNSKTMEFLNKKHLTPEEREHLTLAFYNEPQSFQIIPLQPPGSWPKVSEHFTVDQISDYHFVKSVVDSTDEIYLNVPQILKKTLKSLNLGD